MFKLNLTKEELVDLIAILTYIRHNHLSSGIVKSAKKLQSKLVIKAQYELFKS